MQRLALMTLVCLILLFATACTGEVASDESAITTTPTREEATEPTSAATLSPAFHRPDDQEVGQRWESLTRQEREILALVADGQRNRQIAAALNISEYTVETHVSNLLGKLNVASRAEAIAWVWRQGLLSNNTLSGGNPPDRNGGFPG